MDTDSKKLKLESSTSWLLSAGGDKDEGVRFAVVISLCKIARVDPENLLNSVSTFYLIKDPKQLSPSHRLTLLRVAESVCKDNTDIIDAKVARNLITMALNEMIRSPEFSFETQFLASDLLVALGSKSFCMEVMDALMGKLEPGVAPHPSLLHCLGALATANAFGMVPFIRGTLGTLLPSCSSLSGEQPKRLFCHLIRSFAEAIEEYMSNMDRAPDPSVTRDAFSTEMTAAYDELSTSWIHSRDPHICRATLDAIGPVLPLLPKDKAMEQLPILAAVLLALYRQKQHHSDPLAITYCLCHMLKVASALPAGSLPDPLPEQLLKAAFDQVSVSPDISTPLLVKNHYEALRCIQVLAGSRWKDFVWEQVIQKLKGVHASSGLGAMSGSEHVLNERVRALWVLVHLISSPETPKSSSVETNTVSPGPWISHLTPILQGILSHSDIKMKKVLIRVIVALLSKEYLTGADSRPFVEFIIVHCSSQNLSVSTPNTPSARGSSTDEQSLSELGHMCSHSLNLLATSVPSLKPVLRPLLVNILIYPPPLHSPASSPVHENESHQICPHPASPAILRCLSLLISSGVNEVKEEEGKEQKESANDDEVKESTTNLKAIPEELPSLPEALAVLARCLTLLAHPFYPSVSSALGVNTLIFLQHYAANLHPTLPSLFNEKIPNLMQTLKDFTGTVEEFDMTAWFHQIVGLLDSSLALVGDSEWTKGVGKALASLLLDSTQTTHPSFQHHLAVIVLCPKQRSLVFSLLGAVGVWCSDQEFLNSRIIETLLASPYDVTSPAEAEACAAALGRVAKRHPTIVLKALTAKAREFGHGSNSGLSSGSGGGFGGGIMAAKHFIQRLPFGKASQQASEEARRRKEAGFQRANVTLLLCYGRACIAIAGDPSALGSFLDPKNSQETGGIAWILQHFDFSKGLDVRLAALATLRQICSAVLAFQPAASGFTVDCPNQNSLGRNGNSPLSPALVQAMRQTVLDQIGGELTLLAPSIQTLNMLSKLSPSLSSDERITILKVCFDTVFLLALTTEGLELAKQEHGLEIISVPRVRGGSAFLGEHDDEMNDNTLEEEHDREDVDWKSNESAGEEVVYFGVVEALNQLKNFVQSMLAEKTCAGTLGEIFTLLEAWMAGPKPGTKGESSPYTQYGVQRMAAMLTLRSALNSYLKHFKLSFQVPSKFTECGWMAGVILPRCSDSYLPVRPIAVSCLRLLLLIVARYDEGLPGEPILEPENELNGSKSPDSESEDKQDCDSQLGRLVKEVTSQDPDHLFHAMEELAKVTCNYLRNTYMLSLVEALLDRGLGDGNTTSSGGASVALNSVLKVKGGYLPNHVPHILDMMLGQVSQKTCPPQTRTGAIRAVIVLATHHPKATVSALLLQALPFDECVVDCWKMLAQDQSLSGEVLQNLLSVIEESPPYEAQDGDNERRKKKLDDRDTIRVANLAPLSAISAMQEMLRCAAMQKVALQLFPELLSALLMAMGCYVGTSPPVYMAHRPTPAPITAPRHSNSATPTNQKESSGSRFSFVPNRKAYKLNPARVAQGALQAFLLCCDCNIAAEALLKCSNIDAGENLSSFIEMMPSLTRALCKQTPNEVPRIATRLNHYAASASANEAQLVTVTAFYAELIHLNGNGSDALVEVALEHLLTLEAGESPSTSPALSDSSVASSPESKPSQWSTPTPLLRILCLRGLANTASLINSQQKGRRINSILRTLIRGVGEGTLKDKAVGSVALEAMYGLSNLLPVIPEETVREVGVTVALHIKPYLDKENNASLRSASIRLLGNIAKYGGRREHKPSSPSISPVETEPTVVTSGNWNAFEEQVKSNLVCLLLRLADNEEEVVRSCKFALREMSYVMEVHWNAKKVALMVQQHLIDNALLHYERFMTDLVKLMVEEFPEDHLSMLISSATSYLHAASAAIRGNAALLLGQLFGSMEEKKRENPGENSTPSGSDMIPLESLSARLSQLLLSDPDAGVRAKAAQAIARLFE